MEKLNQTFFYTLEKTSKVYRQYFQSQLKKGGFEITLDQWLVMVMIIDYEGISQTEIAERVFKDKASVTRIIELLVGHGYIDRKPHLTHGKMWQLDVTEKGYDIIERLKIEVPKIREAALKNIDSENLQITQEIMNSIIANCK
jgi:MarR family transcriptional regulator for hemolysin